MRYGLLLLACLLSAQTRDSIELQRQSVARQREAVRQQTGAAVPVQADCEAIEEDKAGALVETAAKAQNLPAKLLQAVIGQESGFHPCAVSSKGAQGLMQLMPATA